MSRAILFVAVIAAIALSCCSASEVEDLGAQPVKTQAAPAKKLGEATKAKARTKARAGTGSFGGALMTSGSFTMMASGGAEEEEREERDELGEANDWDITNGGQCEESEEAWVL